ncbi:DNA mismatch repair endonuclease MutL [Candidatus Marinamargulisbacteria bacterium SCGC AG-333-B06]|nr:DNA mismatch repair endonuclease MutL [Candidatus Marinamargulisbacteria bacterium SCGC AG-333-B06]
MVSRIQQLDSVTINKIAAGEVIDRPASIVKELIENSLDANASSITIEVKEGGKQFIRITDNGDGFHKDDLALAPLRHATSKIRSLDDIYETQSFGFRGEALSSICHCAHLCIISKQKAMLAYEISAYKETISSIKQTSHADGTTITITDLFHEIPVRQKFLKTSATELSYILDYCLQFSLAHPHVSFILTADNQEKLNTTGIVDLYQLMIMIYGKSLKDACVPVHETIGPITFSGYLSDPTLTFSNRHKQIITVNGRLIKNNLIMKALADSYRDMIPQRRFPLAILNITIEQSLIDVNIHPQKSDIKFVNPGFLFDCLPKVVMMSLQASDKHTLPIEPIVQTYSSSSPHTASHSHTPPIDTALSSHTKDVNDVIDPYDIIHTRSSAIDPNIITALPNLLNPLSADQLQHPPSKLDYIQVLNTYIFLNTPTGAYIIDQHAVHERILYEQIKQDSTHQTARQVLLLSEIVDVSLDLMVIFESECDYFLELNFVIDHFGPNQLIVREIPNVFQKSSINTLLISILNQLKEFPGSTRNLTLDQKETLQRQACRAAIKAGQTLYPEEVNKLLYDFIKSPQNYTCPHGRPLFIYYDQSKLESLFLRK